MDMRGPKMTTFTNAERGLEVIVRAVFSGSKHRPDQREPSHYVVRLHAEGITLKPGNEVDRSAKAATRGEAFDIARSFMAEFSAASV